MQTDPASWPPTTLALPWQLTIVNIKELHENTTLQNTCQLHPIWSMNTSLTIFGDFQADDSFDWLI
jgi:hypothetical protein